MTKLTRERKIKSFIYSVWITMAAFSANYVVLPQKVESLSNVLGIDNGLGIICARFWYTYEKCLSLEALLLAVALLYIMQRMFSYTDKLEKTKKCGCLLLAMLYAIFLVIGRSFSCTGGVELICGNHLQFFISVLNGSGYFIILYYALSCFFVWTDEKNKNKIVEAAVDPRYARGQIVKMAGLLLVFYLPYIILFFPGAIWSDVSMQMLMYNGAYHWTTHHPIFTTLFTGWMLNLGKTLFGNAMLIVFLICLTQLLVGIWSLCYAIQYIYYRTGSKKIRNIMFLIFATALNWAMLFFSISKDSLYDIGVLWFTIYIMKILDTKDNMRKRDWFYFAVSIALVDLTRNNGIYLLVVSIFVLLIRTKRENKRGVILVTILTLLVCSLSTNIAMKMLDVGKGSIREALSIPFQQTARYVNTYELTEEEYQTLSQYADVEQLKNAYNAEFADYVKWSFQEEWSTDDLKGYIGIWWKMFLKHPITYIEATMANTYGYVYPFQEYLLTDLTNYTIFGEDTFLADYKIHQLEVFKTIRDVIIHFGYFIRRVPVIGIFYCVGIYTWITLFLVAVTILNRNRKNIAVLMPAIMTILVCFASPVNSYRRYMEPVLLCLPFAMVYILFCLKNDGSSE